MFFIFTRWFLKYYTLQMDGIAMFQALQATSQPISTTLIKPNFISTKWDGDLRLAFQFIPFAQNLLDQAGLSYILDLNATPFLIRPQECYDLVAMDTRNRAQQANTSLPRRPHRMAK